MAARQIHQGFLGLNGTTTQPRFSLLVGSNFSGTSNFGVFNPTMASIATIEMIAIMTAKSLIMLRTCEELLRMNDSSKGFYNLEFNRLGLDLEFLEMGFVSEICW